MSDMTTARSGATINIKSTTGRVFVPVPVEAWSEDGHPLIFDPAVGRLVIVLPEHIYQEED